MVAQGRHPEELAALARECGHASASRAQVPDPMIVQLIQAERLVECFEADLWAGAGNDAALVSLAETACESSYVPMPAISPAEIATVRERLTDFACEWMDGGEGHVARLSWPATEVQAVAKSN